MRVKWKRGIPKVEYRTSSMVVDAEFCAPDNLLDSAWNDIVNCAIMAGVSAGIASLVATPAAATGVFLAIFEPCVRDKLADRASELQAHLSVTQKPNEDWHS
jgi:hypothetical protein